MSIGRELQRIIYEKKLRERFAVLLESQNVDEVFGKIRKEPGEGEGEDEGEGEGDVWSLRNTAAGTPPEATGKENRHRWWLKQAAKAGVTGQPDPPPSAKYQQTGLDPFPGEETKVDRPGARAKTKAARKRPRGSAEGEQPKNKIGLEEASMQTSLIANMTAAVRDMKGAFGLPDDCREEQVMAIAQAMSQAAMQAGQAMMSQDPVARGDGSGAPPKLSENWIAAIEAAGGVVTLAET